MLAPAWGELYGAPDEHAAPQQAKRRAAACAGAAQPGSGHSGDAPVEPTTPSELSNGYGAGHAAAAAAAEDGHEEGGAQEGWEDGCEQEQEPEEEEEEFELANLL